MFARQGCGFRSTPSVGCFMGFKGEAQLRARQQFLHPVFETFVSVNVFATSVSSQRICDAISENPRFFDVAFTSSIGGGEGVGESFGRSEAAREAAPSLVARGMSGKGVISQSGCAPDCGDDGRLGVGVALLLLGGVTRR